MRHVAALLTLATLLGCTASRAPVAAVEGIDSDALTPAGHVGPPPLLPRREGSVIARAVEDDALFVADEDHQTLRVLGLPVDVRVVREEKLPGRPAQVLALPGRVLVTVRDPGLLLVLRRGERGTLSEESRIPIAADAWGLAVSPDERTAVVTSAWSHTVTGIDLERSKIKWTANVPREPRGVTISPDGASAWISHLVGSGLTRLDGISTDKVAVRAVPLPAAPLAAPIGQAVPASLGYALTLSPDGSRLYAARHALGAMGLRNWYGTPTLDVLLTADQEPLAPARSGAPAVARGVDDQIREVEQLHGFLAFGDLPRMAQPRDVAFRRTTGGLLVVSEGDDTLLELDARAMAPALRPRRTFSLETRRDPQAGVARFCGAPSGLALSADENTAFVFCRSTYSLAIVPLAGGSPAGFALADDPLGAEGALGRKVFYTASDSVTSGGLACAGCHPEGRDDGHVWHEVASPVGESHAIFVANAHMVKGLGGQPAGFARRTPMLAGRVSAPGPYGWHAQSEDLMARALDGFTLHRWDGAFDAEASSPTTRMRARPLAGFLREGLVPPPKRSLPLSADEERGKVVFFSEATGCSGCHDAARGYTDRTAHPLGRMATRWGFVEEPELAFKTPSLLSVGGTAPYLHDGSAASLEALIAHNNDRMGRTNHLSQADRSALVAFLSTL